MKKLCWLLAGGLSMCASSYAQSVGYDVYRQDFENSAGAVPSELLRLDNDNCNVPQPNPQFDVWYLAARNMQGDSGIAVQAFFAQNPCTANDWLIINRPLSVRSATATIKLAYEVTALDSISFDVRISTTGTAVTDFMNHAPLLSKDRAFYNSYHRDTIDLSAWADSTFYLAFNHRTRSGSSSNFMFLDNIHVWSDVNTGIEQAAALPLSIYPNPAQTELTIQHDKATYGTIEVFDMCGVVVYRAERAFLPSRIPVGTWAAGLYNVRIQTESDTHTIQFSKL